MPNTNDAIPFPDALQDERNRALATIDAHIARLGKDPYEAMHWINAAVEAAATLRVLNQVRESCQTGKGDVRNNIRRYATQAIYRLASHGAPKSSAWLDIVLQAEELRAWKHVAECFESEGS